MIRLNLAQRLERAGMPPKQAQEESLALAESFGEFLVSADLATRKDLQELRGELRTEIAELRGAIETEIAGLETKIAGLEGNLEAKIVAAKAEILKWMFAQTTVILSVVIALLHWKI